MLCNCYQPNFISLLNFSWRSAQSVQLLSRFQLFVTPWTTARQASLFFTISPEVCSNSCHRVGDKHPTSSSSVTLFSSCLQSFPASGSFSLSQFFTSGGQSIGASPSGSVLPVNIHDWFPLGWTGWISVLSKGLSRVFSITAVQKHQFSGAQLSLQSNSHIHTWICFPIHMEKTIALTFDEVKLLSCVRLFAAPWTIAFQAPLSMEFSRQEYWSGLPFLSPGGLPNPGIEPGSPVLQADALPSEPPGKPLWYHFLNDLGFPGSLAGKESSCSVGDLVSIPGLGRSPGEGKGYTLQYSGLENSMDCIIYGVTKSWTGPSDFHFTSLFKQSIFILYSNTHYKHQMVE